jgi:hypothetical protein
MKKKGAGVMETRKRKMSQKPGALKNPIREKATGRRKKYMLKQ